MPTLPTLARPALAAGFAALLALLPAASATRADDAKSADGFIALFNGKDLTGWKIHPKANTGAFAEILEVKDGDKLAGYSARTKSGKTEKLWRVENGLLVGSGPASHLFSEQGDFTDLHMRVEAKINDGGNSGMYFRTQFAGGFPPGYEVQINATHGDAVKTGSLYPDSRTKLGQFKDKIAVMNVAAHKPDEFFVQEAIVTGSRIVVKVNGKQTVDFTDPNSTYTKGHFALQGHDPGTVVTFKRVEYKPLTK